MFPKQRDYIILEKPYNNRECNHVLSFVPNVSNLKFCSACLNVYKITDKGKYQQPDTVINYIDELTVEPIDGWGRK